MADAWSRRGLTTFPWASTLILVPVRIAFLPIDPLDVLDPCDAAAVRVRGFLPHVRVRQLTAADSSLLALVFTDGRPALVARTIHIDRIRRSDLRDWPSGCPPPGFTGAAVFGCGLPGLMRRGYMGRPIEPWEGFSRTINPLGD